jgi:PmbA protein
VLAGALSADAVQKGRSLFANLVGEQVGSELFTLVDDGTNVEGPGAAPFDGEGVPSGRTELFTKGVLNGFLHNAYTAHKGGTVSTGNGKRGYRSPPGVGTSNFYLDAGETSRDELLRRADGGVLIQDVSGVHSGANPISGEFSVGATDRRRVAPGTAPGDDDRLDLAGHAEGHHRCRRRPAILLVRGNAVGPDRGDDARRRLIELRAD